MALAKDVLEQIDVLVRGGFETAEDIVTIVCEEMYAPGELDRVAVERAVAASVHALEVDKRSWPETTDADRIDNAFAELSLRGVLALQYAGNTLSDGLGDVAEVRATHPEKESLFGYCFFHAQDLDRAVRGEGLFLAFGALDAKASEEEAARVGRIVVEELARQGLPTEWSGDPTQRIALPTIVWQRR